MEVVKTLKMEKQVSSFLQVTHKQFSLGENETRNFLALVLLLSGKTEMIKINFMILTSYCARRRKISISGFVVFNILFVEIVMHTTTKPFDVCGILLIQKEQRLMFALAPLRRPLLKVGKNVESNELKK